MRAIRRILLLFLALAVFQVCMGEKKVSPLKNMVWYLMLNGDLVVDEFDEYVKDKQAIDPATFAIRGGTELFFQTKAEVPVEAENKLFIEGEKTKFVPRIVMDGQTLINVRQDRYFTAEVLPEQRRSEQLITVVIRPEGVPAGTTLYDYLDSVYLSVIEEVTIAWCEPMKDPFFGGYMIEVHVWNLLPKDIDGKLMARILDAETFDVVAENNNCAFTRSNSEAVIDINFPEAKEKLKAGNYRVEITLVDKERNEEVVDQLAVSVMLD